MQDYVTSCEPKTWFTIILYSMTLISHFRDFTTTFFFLHFQKLLIRSSSQARCTTFTNISANYYLLHNTSVVMLLTLMSYTDIIPECQFCRCLSPKDSVDLTTLLLFPWNTVLYILIWFYQYLATLLHTAGAISSLPKIGSRALPESTATFGQHLAVQQQEKLILVSVGCLSLSWVRCLHWQC